MPTRIEWTDETWNPVTGCSAVSAGCEHCYARRWANRLQSMHQPRYANGFRVTLHPDLLEQPLRWRRPRRIFVCSMGDLFHGDVPAAFIRRVFEVVAVAPQHTFQVLTKRTGRLLEFVAMVPWPNLWLGATVEDEHCLRRVEQLRGMPAAVRFLSLEPLLGPLSALDVRGIHWVIVGGETGPGARGMDPAWPRSIRDQCVAAGVPFFFKRWGGSGPERASRTIDGRLWEEMP